MDGRLIIENNRLETQYKLISLNPATLESVGKVSLASSIECQKALQTAKEAFPSWKTFPVEKKTEIFQRAKKILHQRSQEAADLITKEKGSPLLESLSVEVWGGLEVMNFYPHYVNRSLKAKKTKNHVTFFSHKRSSFHFQPLGPTLIISPWNFPFLIPLYDIMSALTSGNTVVFRPSTTTPFIGLFIGEIFIEAGLPPGVLNVITCKVPQAEEMITNPDFQTIMFTGSVSTGKRIMELASQNLTNIVLELGGKDPMIILKDADLERASRGAVWAAFMNCGQSCASVERVYVASEIADEFISRVLTITKKLNVGNPMEPNIDIGPMAISSQLEIVDDHIRDALENGAHLMWGGKRIQDLRGHFIQPTILSKVTHDMKVMKEETFGPILPIMTFSDSSEAISLANDTSYGLTASVWTRDKKMASWMAERIEAGTVTVNDHMFSFVEPGAIWGGIKNTGIGRSHGYFGLLELSNIKYISYDFKKKKIQLYWYPYTQTIRQIIEKSLILFHHDRVFEKIKALLSLMKHMPRILKGIPFSNFIKGLPRFFRK